MSTGLIGSNVVQATTYVLNAGFFATLEAPFRAPSQGYALAGNGTFGLYGVATSLNVTHIGLYNANIFFGPSGAPIVQTTVVLPTSSPGWATANVANGVGIINKLGYYALVVVSNVQIQLYNSGSGTNVGLSTTGGYIALPNPLTVAQYNVSASGTFSAYLQYPLGVLPPTATGGFQRGFQENQVVPAWGSMN